MAEPAEIATAVLSRLMELLKAPLTEPKMLWMAVPLVIATLFITLYFGKYRKEELGWNTAFGNTMVFLFVSLDIIQEMYYDANGVGSWNNLLANPFHLTMTIALIAVAMFLMLVTYYHLLPKRLAFFMFSAPPINVTVYVLMTMVYTEVPADYITLGAAILLFLLISIFLKIIRILEEKAGQPEGFTTKKEKPLKRRKPVPEEEEEAEETEE